MHLWYDSNPHLLYAKIWGNKTQRRQSSKLFLRSSELGLPQPITRRRVCPPRPSSGGRGTLAGERGVGTRGRTLWQSCWTRIQKNSTCTRPSLREIWKVSSLSLSGKKGSPQPSPRSSSPRPPHAENESAIAVRGSRLPPHPALHISFLLLATHRTLKNEKFKVEKNHCVHWDEGWPLICTICFKINIIKSLFTLTHTYIEYTVQ